LNEADFAEPQSVLFLTDFLAAYLNLVVQCGGDYTSALLVETGVGPVAAQAVEFWLDVPLSLYSSLRDDRCTDAFQLTWEAIKDNIIVSQSYDPNDKVGSSGVGVLRSVSGQNPLQYSIHVENVETATAPAQEVVVTDQLDVAKTDLHTFSFEQIYFGNNRLSPSAGSRAFSADVDLRPNNNLIVRVDARLNLETGLVTWRFTSIDPATGLPTDDPVAGFLPPNITPPQGEGIVLFTVMPKQGLSTGTEIRNRARIVFDANAPIDTPEWFNTIDNAKPTSQVLPLSANQCTSFQVGWSGTDIGSGILDYTVFVSENGGPFTVWLLHTTATLGTFAGQSSKSYSFYTVARDRTGNIEDPPTIADANARVNDIQVPVITSAVVDKPSLWPLNHRMIDVAVNYDVTDNCDSSSGITCALTVTSNEPINGTGDGDISPDWEIVGAHHVRLRAERAGNGNGRIYTITITCTDSRGNSSMKTVTVRVPKNQS